MRMHLLSGGRLRMRRHIYYPDAPPDDWLELPVGFALLRHRQGNALFDTGCHPSVAQDAAARWGRLAAAMAWIGTPEENAIDQLGTLGLGPDDIDVVACSHLHTDHCGCNLLFPRASVICHRAEVEAAIAHGPARGYFAADWHGERAITPIAAAHDLFGDGRVMLLPMPGHTPGMLCADIGLDRDGRFLLASDAVSVMASLDADYAPRNTWDVAAQMATLAEIRRLRAAGATVIAGHDAAQWAQLRTGAAFYA